MTDRERLIELIDNFGDDISLCDVCKRPSEDCDGCKNQQLTDYLLANGVIVPVRCKECEHFTPKEKLNPIKYINPLEADGFCENLDKYIDADDFCSYGKLKEMSGNGNTNTNK